MVVSKKLNWCC